MEGGCADKRSEQRVYELPAQTGAKRQAVCHGGSLKQHGYSAECTQKRDCGEPRRQRAGVRRQMGKPLCQFQQTDEHAGAVGQSERTAQRCADG